MNAPFPSSFSCELRRSSRARNMRLTVHQDGAVVLTVPRRADLALARRFVERKRSWILRTVARLQSTPPRPALPVLPPFEDCRERALQLVHSRLEHFNQTYQFTYRRVSVKRQRRLWGSCSRQGNLHFNYRILSLPPHLADYLIVHELCHLGAFNHSPKFWELVARSCPDFRETRRELKRLHPS